MRLHSNSDWVGGALRQVPFLLFPVRLLVTLGLGDRETGKMDCLGSGGAKVRRQPLKRALTLQQLSHVPGGGLERQRRSHGTLIPFKLSFCPKRHFFDHVRD